jgi:hypothetical protein
MLIGLEAGPIFIDWHVAPWVSVVVFAVVLVGRAAWCVVRDWPYRIHWLLPAASGAVATVAYAHVVNREQAGLWWGEFGVLIGASLLVAGWFDHLLLSKTLKPSDATADATNDL